jgi:phosphatidate cytidylyltransferase
MASALVMLAVGGIEVWLGGWPFLVFIMVLVGVMIWELARISRPEAPRLAAALGVLAALLLFADEGWPNWTGWLLVPIVPLLFLFPLPKAPRWPMAKTCALIALGMMTAGHGLFELRQTEGAIAILWVLGVVVVSDVMGYFAGRTLGGPKFWPAISPKKTWSGTVAGWLGAAGLGACFAAAGYGGAEYGGAALIFISPVIAFAGQLGDIAESWLKRRAGVKDSSRLIPGHGGVMDRFDALVGAMLAVMALQLAAPSLISLSAGG